MTPFKPIRFGKYLLFNRIATGGMAELYKAKITGVQGFEKLIAIKKILPHLSTEERLIISFIDEAKIAALLQHPNIVQIYDFGKIEGTYFIAMEYLAGKDLRFLLKKSKEINFPISLEHTLFIAAQICAGLEYAHNLKDFYGKSLNIIHRDIGPQNIFITYDGQVKIIDFGIAKTAMQNTTTQAGSIKGKMAYMSPEQARGENMDQRADLFSIGNTLYEMTTGRVMFKGDEFQVYAKVREADFEPPETVNSNLPASLYAILNQALAKNPEDRYQSANQMLTDLGKCMSELSSQEDVRSLSEYMHALFKDEDISENFIIPAAGLPDHQTEPDAGHDEQKSCCATKTIKKKFRKQQKIKTNFAGISTLAFLILGMIVIFLIIKRSDHNESLPAALKKSEALIAEKHFEDAIKLLEDIKSDNPSLNDQAHNLYSKALNEKASGLLDSDPEKAKALLLRSLQLTDENAEGYHFLGRVYHKQDNYPEAILAYKKAAELDPKMPNPLFNLGNIYAKNKNYLKAEKFYMRVIELSPPFLDEALFNLAYVQEQLGKLSESKVNIEKAAELNAKNDRVREYLEHIRHKTTGG